VQRLPGVDPVASDQHGGEPKTPAERIHT
jgi:hypothetical protein